MNLPGMELTNLWKPEKLLPSRSEVGVVGVKYKETWYNPVQDGKVSLTMGSSLFTNLGLSNPHTRIVLCKQGTLRKELSMFWLAKCYCSSCNAEEVSNQYYKIDTVFTADP